MRPAPFCGAQDIFSRNAEKSRGFPIFPTSREYNTGGGGASGPWPSGMSAPPLCGNTVGKVGGLGGGGAGSLQFNQYVGGMVEAKTGEINEELVNNESQK